MSASNVFDGARHVVGDAAAPFLVVVRVQGALRQSFLDSTPTSSPLVSPTGAPDIRSSSSIFIAWLISSSIDTDQDRPLVNAIDFHPNAQGLLTMLAIAMLCIILRRRRDEQLCHRARERVPRAQDRRGQLRHMPRDCTGRPKRKSAGTTLSQAVTARILQGSEAGSCRSVIPPASGDAGFQANARASP